MQDPALFIIMGLVITQLQFVKISPQDLFSLVGVNTFSQFSITCKLLQFTFKSCIQIFDENIKEKLELKETCRLATSMI